MKRAGSGRIARKIGAHDADDASTDDAQSESPDRPQSVVKRPTFGKSKKRSSLRMSFGPGDASANDGDDSSDAVVLTPKKSNLGRIALEKSAQLRARSPLVSGASGSVTEDGHAYSQEYIQELRNSTPSTPADLEIYKEEDTESKALDIASKFGPAVTLSRQPETSAIPSQAEILEKKARRKRLAQEQGAQEDDEDKPWASDDEGEDDFRANRNEISLRPKDKYAETRLVHEDEDIAEGFDEFVEDGKFSLGRKSEREAVRKRRAEMVELINDAEGSADDDSDDSEEERNAAFATAQARAGRYGQTDQELDDGARTPPRITPVPVLGEILAGLQAEAEQDRQRSELIMQEIEALKLEKVRVQERKQYLQVQLQKTGEKFEQLRKEANMPALPPNGAARGLLITERGLDSMGTTPLAATPTEEVSEEEQ